MRIEPYNAFSDSLNHHGIKGQKWGVRRYDYVAKGLRNRDNPEEPSKRAREGINPTSSKRRSSGGNDSLPNKGITEEEAARREKLKKIAKYAALAGGVALGAYGIHKLSSINSEQKQLLLDRVSKIDKNISVDGWSRDVQKKLETQVNRYENILSDANSRRLSADTKYKMLDIKATPMYNNTGKDYGPELKQLKLERSRANLLGRAAEIMYGKHNSDLDLYKQLDPRNETKIQAAKKAFKSTTGAVKESVKESARDSMLTSAARKAKAEEAAVAANALKEIQKIKVADAKKIIKLYEKDPENFYNEKTSVLDYFKYSDQKIERLMKLAGISEL